MTLSACQYPSARGESVGGGKVAGRSTLLTPQCRLHSTSLSKVSDQNADSAEEKRDVIFTKLLAGYVCDDKLSVVACVACPSLNPEDVEHTTDTVKTVFPAGNEDMHESLDEFEFQQFCNRVTELLYQRYCIGVKLCGILMKADEKIAKETGAELANRFANILPYLEVPEPVICFLTPRDTRSGPKISKTCVLQTDPHYTKLVTTQFGITDDEMMRSSIVARTSCEIPLNFQLGDDWQTSLHNEIERLQDSISSDSTMFRLQSSSVILGRGSNYGVPEDATCDYLPACVTESEEGFSGKKKKQEKQMQVVKFDVYHDLSSTCSLERAPSCAPIVNYNLEPHKSVSLTLPIDTVLTLEPGLPVTDIGELLCQSISEQLVAMETCLCQFAKKEVFHTPVPYHFRPMSLPVILTAMLPQGLTENSLESYRESLHKQLCLPTDRPLFRRANQYIFPYEQESRGYLYNVHEGLPPSKVKDGTQYTVAGQYTYHHYMQDRFDDNKWGCAYRSLQTVISWFKLQGYTDTGIPTHREIQQALVEVGDKEANFVGSRKWIGSMEVSFCLDHLIGVTSKILSVNSGAELSSKGRELAAHFSTQGTPIMIGGGVLAHTILGIDYNEVTGDINFLILDPHYTGAEDLKVIQDKGWCGWKGPEFWDPNVYYNLCMPQRPKVI